MWCWIARAIDHLGRYYILVLGGARFAEERTPGQNANQMAFGNYLHAHCWFYSLFLDWAKTENPS